MPAIITITPNPCIDISTSVPVLTPENKLHCTLVKKEPGGGGINVSRVIKRLGGSTKAICMAGGYTGDYFIKMLLDEKVNVVRIETQNHTRENFVVKENYSNLQYRFGMPGPLVSEKEWNKVLTELSALYGMGYIVASGSLTAGMPVDFFARIAFIAKKKNARLIVDTSGEPLKAALQEGVYMIKPNLKELGFLSGVSNPDETDAINAARSIISKKKCPVVVLSMGANGAMVVTDSIATQIPAPKVQIRSTVGAGDSMVAGIVTGLSKGQSLIEAAELGVACGTAATMNEGTALCNPGDVQHLLKMISNGKKIIP